MAKGPNIAAGSRADGAGRSSGADTESGDVDTEPEATAATPEATGTKPGDATTSVDDPGTDPGVDALSYEEARSRLVEIVAQLEQGALPLEESLRLWELGEQLARHCQLWLDGARERLDAARASAPATHNGASAAHTGASAQSPQPAGNGGEDRQALP